MADQMTVTLVVDTRGVEKALKELGESIRRASANMLRIMDHYGWKVERKLTRYQDQAKRREVMVSGLEARWYVKGGLEAKTEEDITALVQDLWRSRFLMDLSDTEARRLMVAAMTGWAQHSRHGLTCLDCEGRGEWETDSTHPAYRSSVVCHTCDGTGEWEPDHRRGVTEVLDMGGAYLRKIRGAADAWAWRQLSQAGEQNPLPF